jgi:hypothetical protein
MDSEYAVHLFLDHYNDLDAPEGWIPNVPAESLKLANMTSDIKYGWISKTQYGLALMKTAD